MGLLGSFHDGVTYVSAEIVNALQAGVLHFLIFQSICSKKRECGGLRKKE